MDLIIPDKYDNKVKPFKRKLIPIKTKNKCGLLYWNNLFEKFITKRIFVLNDCHDLDETNQIRGMHVNNDCNEILIILQGEIIITLKNEDQTEQYTFHCFKNDYVFIPMHHYLEILIVDKSTIYFVLCDNTR